MLKYRWRSSNARKAQRSDSSQFAVPAPLRPSLSNVVPSGTVASRVRFLEDYAGATSTLSRRPTPTRVSGQSRLSFGRRLTSRFGKPASRNEHPDEEPQVDIVHSYLGLNSIRTNHMEEHGMTDGGSDRRTTYSRASGIHAQVQPQGLTERVQYDALSPWSFTPPNRSIASKMDHCGQKMDPLREVDGFGNRSFFTGRTSIFPTLTAGIGHSDMYRRDNKSRQDATMKSDMSAVTTSTVRRQSVRDLFADYGIERPPGLVSDKAGPYEENGASKQIKSKIRCLNCSWYNRESSNWCVKCKYFLRTVKHEQSYQSLISPKGEQYCLEKVPDEKQPSSPDSSAKEKQTTTPPKRQHVHSKAGPEAAEKEKKPLRQARKLSSLTTKFPSFNMAQSPPKSQIASPRKVTLPELPVAPRLLKGSRTTSIVKDSPFLVADRLSSGRSSNAHPPTLPMDGGIYCRKTRSKLHLHQKAMPVDMECESVACRATHEDHEPYRHSVSCSRKKKGVREETDNGYVADTSFVEDLGQAHSSRQHKGPSQVSKQCSNWSMKSKHAEDSHQTLGSEYIECHGYPRTGHARHGSATSGAIGQCQHCIDDCQCSACQKTHHSVRCCMNENHQGMVHHHHAPKAVTAAINPLDCPTFSSQYAEPFAKSPSGSPARTASTVIPPSSQSKTTPPQTTNVSQTQVNIQPPSKKSTEKPQTLPKSKGSTFLREKLKPPTPPPWISDPKIRSKSPSTTAISKLRAERATADIALNVWAIPDPPPPFKERPTLPPPATCDESSPERSQSRADSDSSKVSKTFSGLFRLGEKNTIPLLNQKLLEHQEELRKIEMECDDRITALSEESGKYSQNAQPSAAAKGKQIDNTERKTSATSSLTSSTAKKKRKWGLSLVDKKPLPPCPNDAPVREHALSDDGIVDEKGEEVCPSMWGESSNTVDQVKDHACIWRNRFLANQNERRSQRGEGTEDCKTPLQGVTVVVHMEGKDDLVIEADLRRGCEVRTSAVE